MRPDANALQALKHQTCVFKATLHHFSAIGFRKWSDNTIYIDMELATQLSAAAVLMTDPEDFGKAILGAARRYHQVNSDRYCHLSLGQDVVANTARLVTSLQYDRRNVLLKQVFSD